MTTESTSAAQPSNTPAPDTSVADTPSTTPTEATEADEDALFRKYAAKANARLDDGAEPPPPREPGDDDPGGETQTTESETPAQAGVSTSEPTKDAPAGTPAAAPAKGKEEQAAPASEPNDDEDLKDLPEEARARVKARIAAERQRAADLEKANKALEHKFRSENARVKALQARAKPAPQQPTPQNDAQKAADAAEVERLKKQYPDVYKAIDAMFRARGGDPGDNKELLDFMREQKELADFEAAGAVIAKVHPAWQDTLRSDEFSTWLEGQPEKVKAWVDSTDPQDTLLLLDRFTGQGGRAAPVSTSKAAPSTDAKAAAEAAALAARRDLQKDGARSPNARSRTAPNETADLSDPEQLYRYYADKANRRLAGSP